MLTDNAFDAGTAAVSRHIIEERAWRDDAFTAYPVQVVARAASEVARRYDLSVCDVLLTVADYGSNLSPEVRRIVQWAFVARAGLVADLNLMRPTFCVLHLPFRGALRERSAEQLGRLHTLVLHVTCMPSDCDSVGQPRRTAVGMRAYRTHRAANGDLTIGGPGGLALSKTVLATPTISEGRKPPAMIGTPLYDSLRVAQSADRLDLMNAPIFDASVQMLGALRAYAAYRRATHKLNTTAAALNITVEALCDRPDTHIQGYVGERRLARSFFVARQSPIWQRVLLSYAVDDVVPEDAISREVACEGAVGRCVLATLADLAQSGVESRCVEDVTPVVAETSRALIDGRLIAAAAPTGDVAGTWKVVPIMGEERLLSREAFIRQCDRRMLPQVVSLAGGLYSAYGRLPTPDDLVAVTPQGIAVDLS